jgi:hypothetical protein
MEKQKNDPMIPPEQFNPAVPKSISFIIGKMTEKNPDHRYPTMDFVLEHLENWDSEELFKEIENLSESFSKVRSYGRRKYITEPTSAERELVDEFQRIKSERDKFKKQLERLERIQRKFNETRNLFIVIFTIFILLGIIIGMILDSV